jgi:phosphosulfolactate phosphohydrolase-like enzyme
MASSSGQIHSSQQAAGTAETLGRRTRIEREVDAAARRFGWEDGIKAHALQEALDRTEEDEAAAALECVSQTTAGVEVRCPAWPQPCSYVRVCQGGFEIGYWVADEWRDQPEEVAGAIFGALARSEGLQDAEQDVDVVQEAASSSGSPSHSLDDVLKRGAIATYVLGTNREGHKELLKFDVRLVGITQRQLLEAEHQSMAMAQARAQGLRDVVAFDELSPAARQMREFGPAESRSLAEDIQPGAGMARVVIDMEGGLIHDVRADAPVRVLILDADIEGSSDGPVEVSGRLVCVSLHERDAQQGAVDREQVGQSFDQALQSFDDALKHERAQRLRD